MGLTKRVADGLGLPQVGGDHRRDLEAAVCKDHSTGSIAFTGFLKSGNVIF